MCKAVEEMINESEERGELRMLVKQVRKGRITIEQAAEDANMSVEQFKRVIDDTPLQVVILRKSRVLLYWMSPNGKQALLQYRFRNVKNLKIYLRQIYRNSLKTYNNQAMRLLREECRHEFGTNYEFAGDNSG